MFDLNYKTIYDISPLISSELGVFPGDQSFERKVVMDCDDNDHISLSSITTTVHLGAHADAPNHYQKGSNGIDGQDLSLYLGAVQVVDVSHGQEAYISLKDLSGVLIEGTKVLFKTSSFLNPNQWNSDFKGLSPELINYLGELGVTTVGIDTPSIDVESSKDLPAHHMVAKYDMAILEGLTLNKVEPGEYYLIALPLKLKDCDASPVRAVLLK